MNSQTNSCFYHSDSNTGSICFRCKKPICNRDKTLYEDKFDDHIIIREYCVHCSYVSSQLQAQTSISDVTSFFFLTVFTILVFWVFYPFLIFSFFIYWYFNNSKKNKVQKFSAAKKNFEIFIQTLSDDQKFSFPPNNQIFCYNCKTLLEPSDRWCPTCRNELIEKTKK